jgi:hypothetical protein
MDDYIVAFYNDRIPRLNLRQVQRNYSVEEIVAHHVYS